MKRKLFKTIALLTCSAVMTTCISASAFSRTNAVKAGANDLEWKSDTSPFTFSQFFYGAWASSYLPKDTYAMKLMTKKTGVTIDRFLATGNDDDFLNTKIAADDLPDTLMLDLGSPIANKLIKSGMVYSVSDLINKYCPKFKKMLDKDLVQSNLVDGKLWCLPNMFSTKASTKNNTPGLSARPWFVRKDLYKEIGSPKLDTPESYLAAMLKVKKLHPDIYPVGLELFDVNACGYNGSNSMAWLIDSFAPEDIKTRINDKAKTISYSMRNPNWINAFRFLNKLYQNNLFDPQLLIYKQAQYEEKLYASKYFIASQFMNDMYTKFNPKIKQTLGDAKAYQILNPLKVNGKNPVYPYSSGTGWQGLYITKKAKNPERIIKWAEYAWSDEGQMDMRYGKLGDTYEMVNGLPKLKKNIIDLSLKDSAAYNAKYGFECSTLLWRSGDLWDKAGARNFKETQPEQSAANAKFTKYAYNSYDLATTNINVDGASPEGIIDAKIKDLWGKTIPKLVMSKSNSEFDKTYKAFIKQMDDAGAIKVEKAMYQKHLVEARKKGLIK